MTDYYKILETESKLRAEPLFLDFKETSFQANKKLKNEQLCTSCFMWKDRELFKDTESTCLDCED